MQSEPKKTSLPTTSHRRPDQSVACGWCGKAVSVPSRGRVPKWCSAACRNKAWQANHPPHRRPGPCRPAARRSPHANRTPQHPRMGRVARTPQHAARPRSHLQAGPARPGAGHQPSPRRHRAAHPGAIAGLVGSWSRPGSTNGGAARPSVGGSSGAQHGCTLLPTRAHEGAMGTRTGLSLGISYSFGTA